MTTPKTILLVEDEALIAMAEARQLRDEGYEVVHAYHGEEAIKTVNAAPGDIDLILMDVDLGKGMDGAQAAQEILKEHDIPVLFLSSHTEPEVVEKTEKITSYGYVVKNTGITVLAASIKMAFKLHAAHQAIQRTNERLSLAQEASNAGAWEKDFIHDTDNWSTEFLKIFGLDADTPPSIEAWMKVVHPEDLASVTQTMQEATDNKTKIDKEYRIILPSQEIRWIRITGKIFYNGDRPLRMVGLCIDITERKWAEEALRMKTEEVEAFFNNALALFCVADTDGNFLRLNQEWSDVLGYPLNELDGHRFLDFVHPDDLASTLAVMGDLREQKQILNFTNRYRCRDGSYRWIEWRSSPEGKRIYAAARDITAKKQTEDALRESEARARAMLHALPDLVFRLDRQGVFLDYKAEETHLYAQTESIIGKRLRDLLPPEVADLTGQIIAKALETGKLQTYEYQLPIPRRGGGKEHRLRDFEARMIASGADEVTAIIRNVTERKQAETKIVWMASFPRLNPNPVLEVDMNGKVTFCNPATLTILERLGLDNPDAFLPPDIRQLLTCEEQTRFEREVRLNDTVWEEYIHRTPEFQTARIFAIDITKRKQAEDNLLRREQEYKTLLDNSPDVIIRFDRLCRHIYVNPTVEKEFGYSPEQLLGKTYRELDDPPENADRIEGVIRQIFETGKFIKYEITRPAPAGNRYYTSHGIPEFAPDGSVATAMFIYHDITEIKQAGAKIKNLLEERELLLKEVYHRVKNDLNMIIALAHLEAERATEPAVEDALQSLGERIQPLAHIYDTLSLEEGIRQIRLDQYLDKVARSLVDLFGGSGYRTTDKQRVELRLDLDKVAVRSKNAAAFGMILHELLTNAFKYAFPGKQRGRISVHLKKDNDSLLLEVTNNGLRLPEGFDMAQSRGMGFLLINIMTKQLGGQVSYERDPETRFMIKIDDAQTL